MQVPQLQHPLLFEEAVRGSYSLFIFVPFCTFEYSFVPLIVQLIIKSLLFSPHNLPRILKAPTTHVLIACLQTPPVHLPGHNDPRAYVALCHILPPLPLPLAKWLRRNRARIQQVSLGAVLVHRVLVVFMDTSQL
ncbi:hypothetical protein FGO68_gene10357 [Halteria grandinella]|uniref:Uncharacterized protein n=1 Tax=Halteria grandinella TaxID=5974 RepID=A0A8J8NR67_HALGN|nr:hypothetical protein FGO68_gene10357 [Halteria grandinella]